MPSIVHLAELSSAVYDDIAAVGINTLSACEPWNRSRHQRTPFGYFAAVYEDLGGQRVIAFRGSNDAFDFLVDDAQILGNQVPPQLLNAVKSVAAWATPNTILTGHSLGGALAILSAARFGMPAVSFNAPRVLQECLKYAFITASPQMAGECLATRRVVNIRIGGDPVSSQLTTGAQIGRTRELSGRQCCLNLRCRHSMKTVLEQVDLIRQTTSMCDFSNKGLRIVVFKFPASWREATSTLSELYHPILGVHSMLARQFPVDVSCDQRQ